MRLKACLTSCTEPLILGGDVMAKQQCFDNSLIVLCSAGHRYLKGDVRSEGGIWKQVVGLSGRTGMGPNLLTLASVKLLGVESATL